MTFEGILENLVSDVVFILVAIAIGWLVYSLSHRATLLKFFGIDDSHRIAIYLSNLRVESGGSIGIDGRARSYEGSAAAFGEMVVADRFRDLFNYILPSLSERPGLLSKLLISDFQVHLLHSPLDSAQIERSASFITLGSPAYNAASGFAETHLHSKAKFGSVAAETTRPQTSPETPRNAGDIFSGTKGTYTVDLLNLRSSGSPGEASQQPPISPSGIITQAWQNPAHPNVPDQPKPPHNQQTAAILVDGVPPMTESTYGFVERIIDHDNKRSVFYAAGISELATAGAAHFLISEWARLHRKYGINANFLVMLRFDSNDYRRWSIIFEK
jgi:hypothetical protein